MNPLTAIATAAGKFKAAYYDAAERSYSRQNLGFGRQQGKAEDNAITVQDRETLRNEALDLYRNDATVHGIVERFADNVVGSGITPQAKTTDELFNREAEDYIKAISLAPETSGRFSMVDVQRMILRSLFVHGDILLHLLDDGHFSLIESERIATPSKDPPPNMLDGVQIDPLYGNIVRFAVFNRNKDGIVDKTQTPAYVYPESAIFMARPFRPDQYRGVPEIASMVTLARDLKEIRQAFLGKVKLEGQNAYAVYLEGGISAANVGARGGTNEVGQKQLTRIENNKIHYLSEKERIQSLASVSPNAQYEGFYRFMCRIMGAAVGLPYEFVLQDFSQGSFSASRAALLQTYATFNIWQSLMVGRFLNRWYFWRISKAIKRREIRPAPLMDDGYTSQARLVNWNFPEWEWVDPQSQQQADLIAFQMGVKSHTDLVGKRGKDSEEVLREKFRNMAIADRIAKETNKDYGTSFTWENGIYAAIPGQVNQAQAAKQLEPPKDEKVIE